MSGRAAFHSTVLALSFVSGASHVFAGADKQVEFFIGTCLHSIDDISRVKSLAAIKKWQKLPEDTLNVMKPVEGRDYEGWAVQYDGELYIVAVNRGVWGEGEQANTCTVIVNAPKDDVLAALGKAVKLKKVHVEDEPLQVSEVFQFDSLIADRAIVQVMWAKNLRPPVNLSIVGITKK
jgi:hypothetical protein